jgi:hypothetical protein
MTVFGHDLSARTDVVADLTKTLRSLLTAGAAATVGAVLVGGLQD